MKSFNTSAICVPDMHYMVDISDKMQQIEKMIDRGDYFTINRARQYGKTTMIYSLCRELKGEYLVLNLSFEGLGEEAFSNDETFVNQFLSSVAEYLAETEQYTNLLDEWLYPIDVKIQKLDAFDLLSKRITWLCKQCNKKIVLMIDEVDKSSNNQVFLHFLGMLRNKYIKRVGNDIPTFWSVILAGVYDIKNMKLKLRPDEEKKYNSPWNIAVDFNVDLSFQAREIATMLQEYENDHHTGMDISSMSEEIFKYTNGYPYLVSAICKFIEESLDAVWTKDSVIAATKHIINNKSPLIDSIIKNYENNAELQMLIERIVIQGEQFPYTITSPPIDLGITFGLFREYNGTVQISNKIFEIVLYNHIIVKNLMKYMKK